MDGSKNVERRPLGAADEEDPDSHSALVSEEDDANEKAPRRSRRVASLDVFRGLTVALMILVDGAGGEWPVIGHAPWNGCNLADFVMPFFLFIVGMAIPLSLKRIPDRGRAVRRVVIRTLKLLFWGILLQGGYSHAPDELTYGVDMKHIRWGGILQDCSCILGSCSPRNRNKRREGSGPVKFGPLYLQAVFFSMIGNSECEMLIAQITDCTDASPREGSIKKDAPAWCVAPFEPEGIVSSFSAVLNTIIGAHCGCWGCRPRAHQAFLSEASPHTRSSVMTVIQAPSFSFLCRTAKVCSGPKVEAEAQDDNGGLAGPKKPKASSSLESRRRLSVAEGP